MVIKSLLPVLAAAGILTSSVAWGSDDGEYDGSSWKEEFGLADCNLQTTGRNQYFVLEAGHQLVLKSDHTKLQITVLDETNDVNGVTTRVVEEREWEDGELIEVSRNYFAMCEQTKDVFYFGEDVDNYEDGELVDHDSAWLAGRNDAKPGLLMPDTPKVGMKYYQEIAPGEAMDRAEIISLVETCETPAGSFTGCLKVNETTPLNPFEDEYKYHAPNIGLIRDEDLELTTYGFISIE